MRARRGEADAGHRLAEQLAVLGLVDRLGGRADHLDVVALEHAHLPERQRAVERRLAAHGRQQREAAGDGVALLGDDLGDDLRGDRLDIGAIGHVRVGHDRRRIGVDQDDAVALFAQGLARLGAGIVELARLTDDDRPGADDQDGRNVGPLRHQVLWARAPPAGVGPPGRAKKGRAAAPPRGVLRRGHFARRERPPQRPSALVDEFRRGGKGERARAPAPASAPPLRQPAAAAPMAGQPSWPHPATIAKGFTDRPWRWMDRKTGVWPPCATTTSGPPSSRRSKPSAPESGRSAPRRAAP